MGPTSKSGTPDPATEALKHACVIIGLEEEGFDFFYKYRIRTVERLISFTNDRIVELIQADPSVINTTDIDQIDIF